MQLAYEQIRLLLTSATSNFRGEAGLREFEVTGETQDQAALSKSSSALFSHLGPEEAVKYGVSCIRS